MHDHLEVLLRHAVLQVQEFDIHTRQEMKTFGRVRPHYVMSYHKKGQAKLRVGREVHTVVPGTVILIPPYVEHDHYKDDDDESVFLWCHFTFEIAETVDVLKLFQIPVTFTLYNHEEFERVFLAYRELRRQSGFLPVTILKKARELELLYLLLEAALRARAEDPPVCQHSSFVEMLAEIVQFPERELSLTAFSRRMNMHPTYICNRFAELFGKPAGQIQREMRLFKAKTLLQSTDLSISEIAQAVGFQAVPSFSRLFKAHVGISPSQYRGVVQKSADPFSNGSEVKP